MSKTKSKDFYRRQHKLEKFKKKAAYSLKKTNKKIDELIENTLEHITTPGSIEPPVMTSKISLSPTDTK